MEPVGTQPVRPVQRRVVEAIGGSGHGCIPAIAEKICVRRPVQPAGKKSAVRFAAKEGPVHGTGGENGLIQVSAGINRFSAGLSRSRSYSYQVRVPVQQGSGVSVHSRLHSMQVQARPDPGTGRERFISLYGESKTVAFTRQPDRPAVDLRAAGLVFHPCGIATLGSDGRVRSR